MDGMGGRGYGGTLYPPGIRKEEREEIREGEEGKE